MIRVLELFGGIGACSKAFERLGIPHEIADYVEIDKYAVKSFNAIHGTNFEPQDVTKWDKDMQVDLIMHGSPCQDFSVAGKNRGGDKNSGTRSSLMYETLRIVEKLKPKYVIWENVKNLLSKKHRHNFDAYIDAMAELGYVSKYQILNAKDYGVPQNRERVFTISCRHDGDSQVTDSFLAQFNFPEPMPLERRLKDILEDSVDERYYLSDEQVSKIKLSNFNQTILSRDYKDPKCVRVGGLYDKEGSRHQAGSIYDPNGVCATLSTMQGGNQEPIIVVNRGRGEKNEQQLESRDISKTVRAGDRGSLDRHSWDIVIEPIKIKTAIPPIQNHRIRKLTPKDFMWHNGVYEERYKENREILQILQQKIGEEAFCEWAIRGLWCVLSESVLWERVYAKGIFENWVKRPELVKFAYFGKNSQPTIPTQEQVRDMWVNWQDRYPSYRRELSEQQFRQLKSVVQKLPHQIASFQGFVQGLWETYESTGLLREALSEMQEIWQPDACWEVQWPNYRIRKLTPLSCWRLMGFGDEDFERAEKVNSNSQLYKQAGNSIVVNVLEEIIRNLISQSLL